MSTLTEEVKSLIDSLPEETTVEDIQYALYVRERVERGIREVEEGKVITHEEAMRRMSQWLGK